MTPHTSQVSIVSPLLTRTRRGSGTAVMQWPHESLRMGYRTSGERPRRIRS